MFIVKMNLNKKYLHFYTDNTPEQWNVKCSFGIIPVTPHAPLWIFQSFRCVFIICASFSVIYTTCNTLTQVADRSERCVLVDKWNVFVSFMHRKKKYLEQYSRKLSTVRFKKHKRRACGVTAVFKYYLSS